MAYLAPLQSRPCIWYENSVVLLELKPGTDIGITTLLFNLQSSNSPQNITMNWLKTSHIQFKNQPACSTLSPISPYSYVPGFSMSKTILLASFRTKYSAMMVSMTLEIDSKP